jgi:uncharacterized protein
MTLNLFLPVLALTFGMQAALAADASRVLTWEEMMPPGEDKVYSELFDKLLAQFEAQMAAQTAGGQPLGSETASGADGLPGISADMLMSDTPIQIGTFNVVSELDGQTVRLPGYVVPLDLNVQSELREFLLVPYFGACIHVPPPPPNQTLYVTSDQPVMLEDIGVPVFVEGVLSIARHDAELADAAYSLALHKVEIYEE